MLLRPENATADLAVSRDTLAHRAADMLRELILIEQLKPNEVLVERDLSSRLGISRTPLREALRILSTEGLVEILPNLRARVANPSLDQLLNLIDVLSSMERLACELMAERADYETLQTLEKDVEVMNQFPDDGNELDFFKVDMDFHRAIVSGTGNQPLITTHGQYNAAVFRARFMSTRWVARRPLMRTEHAEIYQLIKTRNGAAAGEKMRSHLNQLKENVSDLYHKSHLHRK